MAGEPILIALNCALVVLREQKKLLCSAAPCQLKLDILRAVADSISAPIFEHSNDGTFVMDEAIQARIAKMSRRTLIVCGGWLEGAVTQVALSSLLEGYDVYVCADQVVTGDTGREALYLDRIRYCAGHIVTTRQIILEFLSQEKDSASRAPLEALLNSSAAG